jgi:hypothetical protein
VDALVGGPTPAESDATCDDCVMCREPPPAERFDPDARCCTHVPRLPNFLVGAILSDRALPGRASIVARIRAGDGVTPRGLATPATHAILYERAWEAFGRARGLRCPHYVAEGARCGIWRHRNGVCATWFCLHVRGDVGRRYWGAVEALLSAAEDELSVACMLDLGAGAEELAVSIVRPRLRPESLSHHTVDGRADPSVYHAAWGRWAGEEAAFYRGCHQIVALMEWRDVARRCGPLVAARARMVKEAYRALVESKLPTRLRLARLRVESHASLPGVRMLKAEGSPRTVDADEELFAALARFRGQPVKEALRELRETMGVTLDEASLQALVDHGILVPT